MAWRQLVLGDGTFDKKTKRPVYIRDVEMCIDNNCVTLSNNAPRAHRNRPMEEIINDVKPISSGDTINNYGTP